MDFSQQTLTTTSDSAHSQTHTSSVHINEMNFDPLQPIASTSDGGVVLGKIGHHPTSLAPLEENITTSTPQQTSVIR